MSKFSESFKQMSMPEKIADIAVFPISLTIIAAYVLNWLNQISCASRVTSILAAALCICLAIVNWKKCRAVSIISIAAAVVILTFTFILLWRQSESGLTF